ncbi:MAG: hypothetical protein ACK56F_04550 [bacterium]
MWRNRIPANGTIGTHTVEMTTGIGVDRVLGAGTGGTGGTSDGMTDGRVTGTAGTTERGSETDRAAVSTASRTATSPRTVPSPGRSSIATLANHSLVSFAARRGTRSSTVPKRIFSPTFSNLLSDARA